MCFGLAVELDFCPPQAPLQQARYTPARAVRANNTLQSNIEKEDQTHTFKSITNSTIIITTQAKSFCSIQQMVNATNSSNNTTNTNIEHQTSGDHSMSTTSRLDPFEAHHAFHYI